MHHAFGNSLVIEVGDLLAKMKIFQERGAALATLERVRVIIDQQTLIRGQPSAVGSGRDIGKRLDLFGALVNVPMAETTIEPRQPRRLEKKANIH
jgi:hypothetical protein